MLQDIIQVKMRRGKIMGSPKQPWIWETPSMFRAWPAHSFKENSAFQHYLTAYSCSNRLRKALLPAKWAYKEIQVPRAQLYNSGRKHVQKNKEDSALKQRVECMLAINSKLH